MRLSPLSQVRSAITGKHRFPVAIRQIQVLPSGTKYQIMDSVVNNVLAPHSDTSNVCPTPTCELMYSQVLNKTCLYAR